MKFVWISMAINTALLVLLPLGKSQAGGEPYQDLLYRGVYQVKPGLSQGSLACRQQPHNLAAIELQYPEGTLIRTLELADTEVVWFKTAEGCFVRANSEFLQWRGEGEDPSTMCDPRTEPC